MAPFTWVHGGVILLHSLLADLEDEQRHERCGEQETRPVRERSGEALGEGKEVRRTALGGVRGEVRRRRRDGDGVEQRVPRDPPTCCEVLIIALPTPASW